MKREFGKKLIEEYLPKVDLTHVIDTSGAYIPGHGTPTVILFGRAQKPISNTVRAVQGIKGEPSTPEDASQGYVWQSIIKNIDIANGQDEFTSAADVPRTTFDSHPWSIGGGGASDLLENIEENASQTLSQIVDSIGITSFTLEDDVYILPWEVAYRYKLKPSDLRETVVGDMLRDWSGYRCEPAVFPYECDSFRPVKEDFSVPVFRYLWSYRTNLANSKMFGGQTKVQAGLNWYEHGRLTHNKLRTPLSISFAFVATHNHFVLDRGGKVFNRSAPIIKLYADANEDDHIGLLGLLNSSIACFWMQQTMHNKGGPGGGSSKDEKWHDFYEFSATALQRFPVCEQKPLALSRKLDEFACRSSSRLPDSVARAVTPTAEEMAKAHTEIETIRKRMVALQEELDWHCYRLYGLLQDDLHYIGDQLPELALGQRAFEIVMARRIADGTFSTKWFDWLHIKPITEIPPHWPDDYRRLVERRIKLIETNKEIALIEKPDCKRRWETDSWEEQEQRALRNWLLDRLEAPKYRKGTKENPELTTTAQMTDVASADAEFLQAAALYRSRADFDVAGLVAELVEGESVPFLPVLRYKPAGLRKREVWERTWDLQRQQDLGKVVGDIPVPPKYATADFQKTDYWRLRGKLDVPKERWISFPYCETESDPSLVVGWAGWDHLQEATALVAYYDARKREGWDANRLMPLLAGLDQLIPWIHQWHPEVDPEFGETAGQSFQTMLEHDAHELGLTLEEIRAWVPPKKTTTRRKKS